MTKDSGDIKLFENWKVALIWCQPNERSRSHQNCLFLFFFPPLGILSEHSTFGPSEATDGPQHLNKSNNNNEVWKGLMGQYYVHADGLRDKCKIWSKAIAATFNCARFYWLLKELWPPLYQRSLFMRPDLLKILGNTHIHFFCRVTWEDCHHSPIYIQ